MSVTKVNNIAVWRIDSGDAASVNRDVAKAADQLGNGDGKVSVAEMKAFKADMKAIFKTPPTPREFLTDKPRRDAFQSFGHADAVIRQIEHPRSEFVDHVRVKLKPTTDSIDVMLRLVTGRFQ